MKETLISRFTWVISVLIVLACVGWALMVQTIVPDACSYPTPPANAQYLHCK